MLSEVAGGGVIALLDQAFGEGGLSLEAVNLG